jgi:hypothetical protein
MGETEEALEVTKIILNSHYDKKIEIKVLL